MPARRLEPPATDVSRRTREILERASHNEDLMDQIEASFARIARGEPPVPMRDV